jgi:hypothetical protein
MQRKRNEGGGLQVEGWRFCSESAPSIAKTVSPETQTVSPATKSITTFDAFRQNRDFHRML